MIWKTPDGIRHDLENTGWDKTFLGKAQIHFEILQCFIDTKTL
jgi:hypothetical protein